MITIKVEGLEQTIRNLNLTAKEIVKVTRSTVDTTAIAVKNLALNTATAHYNIDKKRLQATPRGSPTIYVRRSTRVDLSAMVIFKGGSGTKAGDRPGLHHYADQSSLLASWYAQKYDRKKKYYPKVRVKKDSGWETIKGGFYQTMPNGGVGIFERIPNTKKIARRTGPGIKQIVENEEINAIVIGKSRELLQEKMREAVTKVIAKRKV